MICILLTQVDELVHIFICIYVFVHLSTCTGKRVHRLKNINQVSPTPWCALWAGFDKVQQTHLLPQASRLLQIGIQGSVWSISWWHWHIVGKTGTHSGCDWHKQRASLAHTQWWNGCMQWLKLTQMSDWLYTVGETDTHSWPEWHKQGGQFDITSWLDSRRD